ncbi:MAG TPA: response regulator transcription factor [Jatrophihabitantaceae bacterium]|nr:response regulator transcription factor [Jatrophihabitantaceae bacterium]
MSEAAVPGTTSGPADRLHAGDIVLDRAAHLVTVRGHALMLAMQEFRLLELLMANCDHVVSSSAILATLWGAEFHGDPGTIAVHVLRLRKKLERWPGASRHLRTVRGIGYVFDTEPVED